MRIFSEGAIPEVFQRIQQSIKSKIESEAEDYLLNVNQTEYCTYLVSQYLIDIPELHFDEVQVDSYEKDIPANRFPNSFHVYPGESYKQNVIRFHIPYSGDVKLLRFRPTSFTLSGGMDIDTMGNALIFEYIDFYNKPEEIKKSYDSDISRITTNYNRLRRDCEDFNSSLISYSESVFDQRKQELLRKNNLLAGLGVPIKSRSNISQTFSVPSPKIRETLKIRPIVQEKGYTPEPILDQNNYHKILGIINDVGRNFEKYPSTYSGKGEEDLRDHILLFLQPNFENVSVSGETFNKRGKTDILLRHGGSNVFIGECKVWKGERQLQPTIDQLLSYSTWRDTKAAVIFFVRNKSITSALDAIQSKISHHPNYLGFVSKSALYMRKNR